MRAGTDAAEDFLPWAVEVHPLHARPRRHDAAHRTIGEVENALDHVALGGVDHPQSGSLGDEVVNVILGQGALETRLQTQQAQEQVGRPVQQPNHRCRRARHERERPGDPNGDRFRVVERDVLGCQLADDESGISHGDRYDGNGQWRPIDSQAGNDAQCVAKPFGKRGTAENSRQYRAGGHSDLDGGQHARRIVGEREGSLGARLLLRQTLQVGAARGHYSQLGHGKKAVQNEQRQHDDDFEDQHLAV
jgi:hypothetical protein